MQQLWIQQRRMTIKLLLLLQNLEKSNLEHDSGKAAWTLTKSMDFYCQPSQAPTCSPRIRMFEEKLKWLHQCKEQTNIRHPETVFWIWIHTTWLMALLKSISNSPSSPQFIWIMMPSIKGCSALGKVALWTTMKMWNLDQIQRQDNHNITRVQIQLSIISILQIRHTTRQRKRLKKVIILHQAKKEHLVAFRSDKQWELNRTNTSPRISKGSQGVLNFNHRVMPADISSKMLWPLKKQIPMRSTLHSIMICNSTLGMASKVILCNSKANSSTRSSFKSHASAVPLRSEHKQIQLKDQAKAMAFTEQLRDGRMPHHICWVEVQRPTNSA